MAKEKDSEMNLVGHLTELRNRIIVTIVFFIIFFIIGFIFIEDIYGFFEADIDFQLTVTGIADIIWIYISIAGILAIVGTLPILSLQLWLFIKPGLKKHERTTSLAYVPAVFFLFVMGLVFGYFLFIQLIVPFLLSLNDGMFNELFTVDKYFKFMFKVIIPFALIFEIPIVSMFLTSLGIINAMTLRKIRKYAYLILLIVGALITPPDIFLQLIVALPLFILYEISIYLSAIVERRKERKHKKFMESK